MKERSGYLTRLYFLRHRARESIWEGDKKAQVPSMFQSMTLLGLHARVSPNHLVEIRRQTGRLFDNLKSAENLSGKSSSWKKPNLLRNLLSLNTTVTRTFGFHCTVGSVRNTSRWNLVFMFRILPCMTHIYITTQTGFCRYILDLGRYAVICVKALHIRRQARSSSAQGQLLR